MKTLIRLSPSLLATCVVNIILIEVAAWERGYAGAYGGEWFLIIVAWFLTFYLLTRPGKEQNL